LPQLRALYSADAWFKDPFNEVRGVEAIERIFRHMYTQVEAPRFVVTERVMDTGGALLVWEFHFRTKGWREKRDSMIRGCSHLRFDATGRVCHHRDYWDTAEELYMKLPLIGTLLAALRRHLSAG
jgi:hypothetical protein